MRILTGKRIGIIGVVALVGQLAIVGGAEGFEYHEQRIIGEVGGGYGTAKTTYIDDDLARSDAQYTTFNRDGYWYLSLGGRYVWNWVMVGVRYHRGGMGGGHVVHPTTGVPLQTSLSHESLRMEFAGRLVGEGPLRIYGGLNLEAGEVTLSIHEGRTYDSDFTFGQALDNPLTGVDFTSVSMRVGPAVTFDLLFPKLTEDAREITHEAGTPQFGPVVVSLRLGWMIQFNHRTSWNGIDQGGYTTTEWDSDRDEYVTKYNPYTLQGGGLWMGGPYVELSIGIFHGKQKRK